MDRYLRALSVVAETGNLTAAANRLNLTQSAVTKHIKRLETDFGAPLITRGPRGVTLTPAGERLAERARAIELQYLYASEEVAALASNEREQLRLGAGPLYHMHYLPLAFETLVREFPRTRLDVMADIGANTVPLLRLGELDMVFGELDTEDDIEGIEKLPMTETEQACVMRADHPLASGRLDAEALSGQTWIVYQHDDKVHAQLKRYFFQRGLPPPRIAVFTSSFATGLRIVSCSDYLMVAPSGLAPVVKAAGLVMRKQDGSIWCMNTGILVRRTGRGFPIVERLIELMGSLTAGGQ